MDSLNKEPFSFPDLAANNGLNASMNLHKHGGMKGNVRDGSGYKLNAFFFYYPSNR